jgi:hypothetical protein
LYAELWNVLASGSGVTILGAQFAVQVDLVPLAKREMAKAVTATVTMARMTRSPPAIATCDVL